MICDSRIHNYLKEEGDIICSFCDRKLQDNSSKIETCCDTHDIINNNGSVICKNCGSLHRYETAIEFVDYRKVTKKSVYHRKYHLNNIILKVCEKSGYITTDVKNKILNMFKEIDKILPLINGERKRMINLNFILKQIFQKLGIPNDNIKITTSKKTLAYYQQYWTDIQLLLGNKFQSIIDK